MKKLSFVTDSLFGTAILKIRGDFCQIHHETDTDDEVIFFKLSNLSFNPFSSKDFEVEVEDDNSVGLYSVENVHGSICFNQKELFDEFVKKLETLV